MNTTQSVVTIVIIVFATLLTRFLPFVLFPEHKTTPQYMVYLGNVLPYSVIGLLLVYCLKDVSVIVWPFALPEIIAIVCIVLLHLWKKNMFISIGVGTVFYMVIKQIIF